MDTFEWKTRQVNDIPSNPLDYYWWYSPYRGGPIGTDEITRSTGRLFLILEQYPSKDGVCIESDSEPELYILFEGSCRIDEKTGLPIETGQRTFLRAFKTLDEAKKRAAFNVAHINALIDSYFPEK